MGGERAWISRGQSAATGVPTSRAAAATIDHGKCEPGHFAGFDVAPEVVDHFEKVGVRLRFEFVQDGHRSGRVRGGAIRIDRFQHSNLVIGQIGNAGMFPAGGSENADRQRARRLAGIAQNHARIRSADTSRLANLIDGGGGFHVAFVTDCDFAVKRELSQPVRGPIQRVITYCGHVSQSPWPTWALSSDDIGRAPDR